MFPQGFDWTAMLLTNPTLWFMVRMIWYLHMFNQVLHFVELSIACSTLVPECKGFNILIHQDQNITFISANYDLRYISVLNIKTYLRFSDDSYLLSMVNNMEFSEVMTDSWTQDTWWRGETKYVNGIYTCSWGYFSSLRFKRFVKASRHASIFSGYTRLYHHKLLHVRELVNKGYIFIP